MGWLKTDKLKLMAALAVVTACGLAVGACEQPEGEASG